MNSCLIYCKGTGEQRHTLETLKYIEGQGGCGGRGRGNQFN